MRVVDFSWPLFCSIAGTDQAKVRLILDEERQRPSIGSDSQGYVVRLPLPRHEKGELYSVQGLFVEPQGNEWNTLWRLYKASLYHAAFHVAFSDMDVYSLWARGKDEARAVFAVSLVEDFRITARAMKEWPVLMSDIAFANNIGALRLGSPDSMTSNSVRLATKLLLATWGVPLTGAEKEENEHVTRLAANIRRLVIQAKDDPKAESLLHAADLAYEGCYGGQLYMIPSFPHTEAHSQDLAFKDTILETENAHDILDGCADILEVESTEPTEVDLSESDEAFQALIDAESFREKVREHYADTLGNTRLRGITFPTGDYAEFLRDRAGLAGPIRSVKNALLMVKNVADEDPGKESGQVDIPVAMQVLASQKMRTDIFLRDESVLKDEAWAILVDTSKSISAMSSNLRGIVICLTEIADALMRDKSKWGVFGFSDKLQVLKDFDEKYSTETKARIGGLTQSGATFLPDALAVVGRALGQRPIDNRFLVVVSDCMPMGYRDIEKELDEQIASINRSGTLLVGVGVQSEAVKKYFRVNAVLTTPYELMKFFVKAYQELSVGL